MPEPKALAHKQLRTQTTQSKFIANSTIRTNTFVQALLEKPYFYRQSLQNQTNPPRRNGQSRPGRLTAPIPKTVYSPPDSVTTNSRSPKFNVLRAVAASTVIEPV